MTKNGNFSENCLNSLLIVDNHWVGSVLITSNIIGVTLGELNTGLKLSKLLYVALWKIWVALLDRKRGNLGGKQVGNSWETTGKQVGNMWETSGKQISWDKEKYLWLTGFKL